MAYGSSTTFTRWSTCLLRLELPLCLNRKLIDIVVPPIRLKVDNVKNLMSKPAKVASDDLLLRLGNASSHHKVIKLFRVLLDGAILLLQAVKLEKSILHVMLW